LHISEKYHDYAEKVSNYLKNYDIRTLIDERSEKIGKKIRDSELKRIPYLLIIGEKEQESNTVSVRKQGDGDKGVMSMKDFADFLQSEVQNQLESIEKNV
jgi:threonyl-tRNA synthetase